MFRARFASIIVAASLAAGGCNCFDHPWFNHNRGCCPPAPTCDPCARGCASPLMDGPMLPIPPEGPPMIPGPPPVAGQPRLVPTPQSVPMAYTP